MMILQVVTNAREQSRTANVRSRLHGPMWLTMQLTIHPGVSNRVQPASKVSNHFSSHRNSIVNNMAVARRAILTWDD